MKRKYKSVSILGTGVSAINLSQTLQFIEESITKKRHIYICVAAVHLIMTCHKNRRLLEGVGLADLVVPDGMPIVWFLKASGHNKVNRVYGPDLMLQLCQLAEKKNLSVFLLGGEAGQSLCVAQILRHRFPGLSIAGNIDTPIRPLSTLASKAITARVNESKPEVVLIGMGCPFQEQWMIDYRKLLKASVLVGVGAAFDIISKKVPQAPGWIQQAGFEWLFRFVHEPRRLWKRYTLMNARFLFLLLRSLFFSIERRGYTSMTQEQIQ